MLQVVIQQRSVKNKTRQTFCISKMRQNAESSFYSRGGRIIADLGMGNSTCQENKTEVCLCRMYAAITAWKKVIEVRQGLRRHTKAQIKMSSLAWKSRLSCFGQSCWNGTQKSQSSTVLMLLDEN